MAMNNHSNYKPKKQGTPILTYVAIILALSGSGATAAYTTETINNIETVREIPIIQNTEQINILKESRDSHQRQIQDVAKQVQEIQAKDIDDVDDHVDQLEETNAELIAAQQEQIVQLQAQIADLIETQGVAGFPEGYVHSHDGIASELRGNAEGISNVLNEVNVFKTEVRNSINNVDNRLTVVEENTTTVIQNPDLTALEQRLGDAEFKLNSLLADFSQLRTDFVEHLVVFMQLREEFDQLVIEFLIATGD